MNPSDLPVCSPAVAALSLWEHACAYQADVLQRAVLFLDVLRQRADDMLAHDAAGLPPLIHFEYEQVLDARRFARPASYALLKITACGEAHLEKLVRPDACPVIVLDPRAGHGPGIGGFKRESEVGVAMLAGHPVYFVMFFPDPCPGQTLADVLHALRGFVEEVARRHGRAPVLYGNCQAGWASALLAAACEGLAGPAVLNGSPLSYWAGEAGVNPMRLAAAFTGGAWLVHFLSDLGNGRFDGAWLVQNFESLGPANTLWEKNYAVFADPEGERERFLAFERWWTGFYFLSREEILDIVQNLFVGNKLESGEIRLCDGCSVNLRNIRNPLLIFASSADNITPPHQALAWIPAVYRSTEDLKAAGQRIVYLLNEHVGHLGIFVSAKVARREHFAILHNIGALQALQPGLYEMKIAGGQQEPRATFEPRRVEDLDFRYPRASFEMVRRISEWNERLYAAFASAWVRAAATPWSAEFLKWAHPMRTSRLVLSERFLPPMIAVRKLAATVRADRSPATPDNPFIAWELAASRQISSCLEAARAMRDAYIEVSFQWLYGASAVMAALYDSPAWTVSPAEKDSACSAPA